ncbi:hypothetical protein HNV11_11005 [Spirosoma taeanense]|uniref:Uncharacterized protein n=1 Tax=Spirosoma taeanense TaxID=2735870 RepID=A0A6M5Y921_9BACT|nr:hypothetical protein [Spirosoma taeanense]QJW89866.1 hypothetical protein HNV11_11005 [Spirosoma taeanense]
MAQQNDIKTFDDLCQHYLTWIIQYNSPTYDNPLFFVLYMDTDEEQTDRFVIFQTGEIFATDSLSELKTALLNQSDTLLRFGKVDSWLADLETFEPEANSVCDVGYIITSLEKGVITSLVLEEYVTFINLYGDYCHQDEAKKQLLVYTDDELIRKPWDYFYNSVFWPQYNPEQATNGWKRPSLDIDTKILLTKLNEVIRTFESRIKVVKSA